MVDQLMPPSVSERISAVASSGTVQLTAILQDLRRRGVDVIDMAVGEPDFAVDPAVIKTASEALAGGLTRYGPVGGLPALRRRIASGFEGFTEDNVIVTNGAKQALYSVFQVLCDKDDEVIIPTPCWVSFSHQVNLAGGRPVLVPASEHQPDIEAIVEAIGPQTVAILLNSPNNPTGAVYSPAAIEAIGDLCRRRNLWLISDEAYQAFDFSGHEAFNPYEIKRLRDRLITIRSFSKTYGMTGFRIGYAAAPIGIVAALKRLQSHLSGNVCTFAQHGALAALDLPESAVVAKCRRYARRRDRAYRLTSEIFECRQPQGAFYLLPRIARYADRFATSSDLAAFLLEHARVAVVPGEHFFAPGHIRISFAVDSQRLEEGFRRMREALTS